MYEPIYVWHFARDLADDLGVDRYVIFDMTVEIIGRERLLDWGLASAVRILITDAIERLSS